MLLHIAKDINHDNYHQVKLKSYPNFKAAKADIFTTVLKKE
jgi:hypothetical protein